MISACLLATLGLAAGDVLSGTWSYRAVDDKDVVVAEGTMTLRAAKAKDFDREKERSQWSHVGNRKVKASDRDKFGPHDAQAHTRELGKAIKNLQDDVLVASLRGVRFYADLSWGWSDDNIYLDGTLNEARIEGNWRWGAFAGYRAKGRFSMVKEPGRVH